MNQSKLSNTQAWAQALKSSAYVLTSAWRHARLMLCVLVLTNAAVAVVPAAQVLATSWIMNTASQGPEAYLPALIVLTLLVAVGQTIGQIANMQQQRVRLRMRRYFQDRLMRAVARMSARKLAQADTTAVIQGCRESVFDMGQLVGAVIAAIGAVATAVMLCITVWTISPIAGILVVLALLPSLFVFAWEARLQDAEFVPHGFWERRSNYAVEQLVTQRTGTELKSLGSSELVANIADGHRARADRHMDRVLTKIMGADTIGAAATAVLLGAALFAIVTEGAGGAGVAAGIVGVIAGMTATRAAGFSFGDIIATSPKVMRYRHITAETAPPQDAADTPRPAVQVGHIALRKVTVGYPNADHSALCEVSLEAHHGEMVALVGVNGAGKTTAVNTLLGLLDPDSGVATVDGVGVNEFTLQQRLALFGLLTQEFGRYEFTVRDTVRLGRANGVATDAEIWQSLHYARAEDFVRALPGGLDTQLGEQFSGPGLSGGQWQRLALARIYLRNPPIWILDEPTSAIDAEAEQAIFAELGQSRQNRITIVVSHRAWTLKNMDRIYVIDQGRVVESGTFPELQSQGGRFAQLFKDQLDGH